MTQDSATAGKSEKKKAKSRQLTPAEEEIQHLVGLCRAGKLFAIQAWISDGKPVNPPSTERKGVLRQTPLEVAIDHGFHSLVEVLLKAGADIEAQKWNGPMDRALELRRMDIIQLLVEHGFDPTQIRMDSVFSTWDSEIMEFFIQRGADLTTGDPLAVALVNRTRTALSVLKRDGGNRPELQKQANIALRYHAQKGDVKWVSLMLWAGADPYARGSELPNGKHDDEESGLSALELAAIYKHYDVLKVRGIAWNVGHPVTREVLFSAVGHEEGLWLAEKLLKLGVSPNDSETGACSGIPSDLNSMSWSFSSDRYELLNRSDGKIDSIWARGKMKSIHLLARAGGRWCPQDSRQVSDARRSLVKLTPEYTLEFLWIMSQYKSCTKEVVLDLVRTPTMKHHLAKHAERLQELLSKWETPNSG